ncbi:MAG: SpoIID/LytB domain-containing protein [Christensenellales bacterium]|jgi:stage II sporulation protein D
MIRLTRYAGFILALILLLSPAGSAWSLFGSGDTAGGVAESAIEDDGMIRVYLGSLGKPESLLLTLAGEYVIGATGAFRFERGTEVIVTASGDRALITVGGLTLDMGASFTFTRCAAQEGEENGIYIYQSERDALYAGDLTISCEDGRLTPIIKIGMEDYLYGVVAYEMSDSFPLEALKAQAVAARTYAMSRKITRFAAAYDVTDTTSDQVYKGLITEYQNVIRAVEATGGVVGTYNGNYASCYYTASNGGQIATPTQIWGGEGDYGYIEMKDDPYDLESPRSLVNSFAAPRAYDAANALHRMLDTKIDRSGHYDVRIDAIESITPTDPKHEGSRMYQKMAFTLTLSARDAGWVPIDFGGEQLFGWALGYAYIDGVWHARGVSDWAQLPETQTVELTVYDDLKDQLALGLNKTDYELASVAETQDGFTIEMRRYGHGVGMSQRGAQWMAGEYGKDYVEILSFYYPGMALERIDWDAPELPAKESLPAAVATLQMLIPPAQTQLPALEDGEYYAAVNLSDTRSRLNVRKSPTTDSDIVVKLDTGYKLIVSTVREDGWARVRTANFEGYVRMDYIRGLDDAP